MVYYHLNGRLFRARVLQWLLCTSFPYTMEVDFEKAIETHSDMYCIIYLYPISQIIFALLNKMPFVDQGQSEMEGGVAEGLGACIWSC